MLLFVTQRGTSWTSQLLHRRLLQQTVVVVVALAECRRQRHVNQVKPGSHPTQRTQRKERKERNEMTSLLDRPITAASDDGMCRWHATKLRQTRHKYKITEIKFDLHHKLYNKSKNLLKFGRLIFFTF